MADTKWLERRGETYYAVKGVPRPLWDAVGKRRLVKSLGTGDLRIAQARRHPVLASFDVAIREAGRTQRAAAGTDPMTELGLAWREVFVALERGDSDMVAQFQGGPVPTRRRGEETEEPVAVAKHVAEMSFWDSMEGLTDAEKTAAIPVAQGLATPLRTYVDRWVGEGGAKGPLRPRTVQQYRSDIDGFAAWLAAERLPVTIEAVTKSVAGRYVSSFQAEGADRKTANRKISALSAYWRWLLKRTEWEVNPWVGQSLSKARQPGEEKAKRPFSETEMALLLRGKAAAEMADVIRLGALTGMRLEEVYRLRVADCRDGWFTVRLGKTSAAVRRVPVHTDLAAIVARRTKGKSADAYLIHEAGGDPKPGRERSMPASKRFATYRRSVGVDEVREGRRTSRVDFHSLRRWFVTEARNAGIDLATVQAVVGHKVGNLTDDTYSGGPGDALLRACVAAVRLPV